jgi:hypothetical protein
VLAGIWTSVTLSTSQVPVAEPSMTKGTIQAAVAETVTVSMAPEVEPLG